jgi:hypothetical protein
MRQLSGSGAAGGEDGCVQGCVPCGCNFDDDVNSVRCEFTDAAVRFGFAIVDRSVCPVSTPVEF